MMLTIDDLKTLLADYVISNRVLELRLAALEAQIKALEPASPETAEDA